MLNYQRVRYGKSSFLAKSAEVLEGRIYFQPGHATGTDWLEVPTIYKAYFLGLCKGISPENIPRKYGQTYGTVPYMKFPLIFHRSMVTVTSLCLCRQVRWSTELFAQEAMQLRRKIFKEVRFFKEPTLGNIYRLYRVWSQKVSLNWMVMIVRTDREDISGHKGDDIESIGWWSIWTYIQKGEYTDINP